MSGLCTAGCFKFGFLFMAKMYMVPYWINVMWLDVVTYLHHTVKEVRPSYRCLGLVGCLLCLLVVKLACGQKPPCRAASSLAINSTCCFPGIS